MATPTRTHTTGHPDLSRRSFLARTAGAVSVAAAGGGLAGILGRPPRARLGAGHEAPRPPLGRLHPRGRRRAQAPGARGGQGARVPRSRWSSSTPTTSRPGSPPRSSRAAAPTSSRCSGTGRNLYANGLVDVSDVAEPIGKAQGGYYDVFSSTAKVGGKWLAVPHGTGRQRGRVPALVARGDRPPGVPEDLGRVARGGQEAQGQGQAGGPGTRAQLRRPAHLRLSAPVGLRRRRGRPVGQEGRHQQQGGRRLGEVPAGVLEGRVRRGRPRLGRHEQQPGVPRGRDLGHAQRRQHLHRRQAPEGQDQDRQGGAALPGHRARGAAARRAGRPVRALRRVPALDHEVLEEPGAGQELPASGCTRTRTTASGSR